MTDVQVPRVAILKLPPWLWGGSPEQFLAQANFRFRPSRERGFWTVQTVERYARTQPSLVTAINVAGPGRSRPQFDLLHHSSGDELLSGTREVLNDLLEARRHNSTEPQEPADAFREWQISTMLASTDELISTVAEIYNRLREAPMGGGNTPAFPNSGVYLIRRTDELIRRAYLAPVMLRLSFDRRLGQGDLAHITDGHSVGDRIFASSEGLRNGLYLFDSYIAPLMGALTPYIWALSAHREFGIVVFTLGRPLTDGATHRAHMLDTIPTEGPSARTPPVTLSPRACGAAIEWWAHGLNSLFGTLTDPAIFTDASRNYVPTKHLHALLTVEQLFKRVTSIQVAHNDINARRVLLFSVLDTLERLTGRNLEMLCSLTFAQRVLSLLQVTLPADAAEVLLPGAERAVAALSEVQAGFFMPRAGDAMLALSYPDGSHELLSLETAAAQYIRVLRDATHGHGSNRAKAVRRTDALLANHDGAIPHDLGLLGYLYLLQIIAQPTSLQRHLYRQGKV